MPQRSLHPLVYILLMWLTILSIVQVVFIAFFFTLGQNGQSSSLTAGKPGGTSRPLVDVTSPITTAKTNFEKGTVLNYQATNVNGTNIGWTALKPIPNLISENEQLYVKRDGYYFLSLRVTLDPCEDTSASDCLEHTVFLKYGSTPLLKGWIDRKTHSSGQLSMIKGLSEGEELTVTIYPPTTNLNPNRIVTHLDIVFMRNLLSS